MSGQDKWQGFSDREIKNLQQGPQQKRTVMKEPSGKDRPQSQMKKIMRGGVGAKRQGYGSFPTHSPPVEGLSEEAFFKDSTAPENVEHKSGNTDVKPEVVTSDNTSTHVDCNDKDRDTTVGGEGPQDAVSGITFSDNPPTTLEMLQQRQREIEAQNKRKKALLEQTLQERYQRSQMEAKTLEEVKKELFKLDNLVSHDVSLLREKIEEANRQYTAARKKYEQVEVEFVAAKMELHKKSELKELLSEHLCTVIQQNEARKAGKLANLMQALHIESPNETSKPTPLLFQRTPTPGMDIWPKERLRSNSKGGQKAAINGALESSPQTGNEADSKQGKSSTPGRIGNGVVSHSSNENEAGEVKSNEAESMPGESSTARNIATTTAGELVKNHTPMKTHQDFSEPQLRDHQSDTELRHQNSE